MGRKYKQLSLEERCDIARLQAEGRSVRQMAAALDRPPSTISRELKRNSGRGVGYKPSYAQQQTKRGAGQGRASNATPTCAAPCSTVCAEDGRRSRWPGGCAASAVAKSSVTRASIGSFTRRSPAPRTIVGVSICHAARANAASADGPAEARQTSSKAGFPCPNGRLTRPIERHLAIGKPILCCSPDTVRPCSPFMNATRASCLPQGRPIKSPIGWHVICDVCSQPCPKTFAGPSLSIMAPSSLATRRFTALPCKPSSVTHMRLGKRAGSKMLSAASAASFRARPTWQPFRISAFRP